MDDVLGWANVECGRIHDVDFRAAAELALDPIHPRSILSLVEDLIDRGLDLARAVPTPTQMRALRQAVEFRLRVAVEDLREQCARRGRAV